MHVREALMSIASTINNELRFDQVAGVVSSSNWDLSGRLDFTPMQLGQIQLVGIVQCLQTIAATKDIDAIVVYTSRVSTAPTWSLSCCLGIGPSEGI